ncbi:hypothetical protein F5Y13DRAFT_59978 [Hypoxylon sp. FL1857]|nr:hypothetical protein F5Y13DRAFT_59978 [Hypoxylon sp. FL1857]
MSADLFAAFEDSSKPAQSKGQRPNASAQSSSFTSDPFSFGLNNATNPSDHVGQYKRPAANQWGNERASWSGPLRNIQQPSSAGGWTGAQFQPTQPNVQTDEDDDDGWGDFEVAPNVHQPSATSVTATIPSRSAAKEPQNQPLGRTRVVRASTIDLMTNNLLDLGISSTPNDNARGSPFAQGPSRHVKQPTPKIASPKAPQKTSHADSNVLFDADDFDGDHPEEGDEDDFGEFETVASPVQAAPDLLSSDFYSPPATAKPRASELLSGLNLTEPTSYPQAPRSPSFQDRNPFPGLAVAPPRKQGKQPANEPIKSPVTAWPALDAKKSAASDGFGDDWAAFDDLPSQQGKSKTKNTNANTNWDWDSVAPAQPKSTKAKASVIAPESKESSWDWDPVEVKTEKQADEPKDDLPPTNIPPPSILLSVFPELFSQANASLYKPVSGQPFPVKNRILSDPKTIEFLRGYIALATVAARIIAGRKLRWHRDKFLAQRMTISAAGSKGMKLAGIDKAQAAREDREAADVVAYWKEYVGRLRSAVATANSSIKNNAEQLKIPEISESMPVQTEKLVPTAPKACIVCGLKRNERIAKVDYDVEDSFGEWWVDHWGHLACKRFWLQHESTLRQR